MDEQDNWLSVPEVAETLQVRQRTVRQYLREKTLLAVRRGPNEAWAVPASFFTSSDDGALCVLPTLPSTITVLCDAGFTDEEAVAWLLSTQDELGSAPIDALQQGHIHAVRRLAQSQAL